jgi:hypothetical protein
MLKPIGKVPIFPLLPQASDLFCWFHDIHYTVALTTQLTIMQEALTKEKTAQSAVDRSLAEEKMSVMLSSKPFRTLMMLRPS